MRISDWSSDVCSSDLADVGIGILPASAAQRCARVMDIHVAALKDDWAVRQSMICARNIASLPLFTRTLIALLPQAGSAHRSAEQATRKTSFGKSKHNLSQRPITSLARRLTNIFGSMASERVCVGEEGGG